MWAALGEGMARESRPEVLRWDGNRSRARRGPPCRSVRGYVFRKVGRTATVLLLGRVGRSMFVTEIKTNFKQDRLKLKLQDAGQRR